MGGNAPEIFLGRREIGEVTILDFSEALVGAKYWFCSFAQEGRHPLAYHCRCIVTGIYNMTHVHYLPACCRKAFAPREG